MSAIYASFADYVAAMADRNQVGTRARESYICCMCGQSVPVARLIRRQGALVTPEDHELPRRRFVSHRKRRYSAILHPEKCPGSGEQLSVARGFDR